MIEPQGGELPYELANRSPKKFYDQVLHQDVKRYSVSMRGKITGEWTQRPLLKIITNIKERVIQRIAQNIGENFEQDILRAFEEGGLAEEKLFDMLRQEQIDLVDQD